MTTSEKELLLEIVRRGANDIWGLGLSETQLGQFVRYAELLVEWNATRLNLTRLTSPHDIAIKHFLDSLALLTVFTPDGGARVMDVGTGAGLPGLALKIARPDLTITLLDSTGKKLAFCQAVVDEVELEGVDIVHARAEDAAKRPELAGQFDLVTARAVASLAKLLPWLAPFAAPQGQIVALKGGSVESEIVDARLVARKLGLALLAPLAVSLPESEASIVRQIVVLRKYPSG